MNKKQGTLLAVYGTLKQGFHNHRLLNRPGVKFLGAYKTEPRFTMVSCGGFPAVHCQGSTPIHTEIYSVESPEAVEMIYRLEGYSGTPTNKGGKNWYDVEEVETPFGSASMFVFRGVPARPVVKSGNWGHE